MQLLTKTKNNTSTINKKIRDVILFIDNTTVNYRAIKLFKINIKTSLIINSCLIKYYSDNGNLIRILLAKRGNFWFKKWRKLAEKKQF